MKKIKDKEGRVFEVSNDYIVKQDEEEVLESEIGDDEEKKLKVKKEKMLELLDTKVENIVDALKTEIEKKTVKVIPAKKNRDGGDDEEEYSVMNTEVIARKYRPFKKLSKSMENFIEDIRRIAVGGMPKSLVKAMTEGSDVTGGFLVPEEFHAEVIRYASETAIVRPRARVFGMARDILTMPKLDQSTDQFGGVELYWEDEGASPTAEKSPALGKITLYARKLRGITYVTEELLADAAVNVANFLVTLFGEALAYEEDKQFLTGNGMKKPLGVVSGGTLVSRNESNKIKYADITKMFATLPAWAHPGAVWITTLAGLEQLLLIRSGVYNGTSVDETKGVPLITATGPISGIAGALPMTILGKPILLTDKLPEVGTKGDLILADLGWYFIGDRGVLEVLSSTHARFLTDEIVLKFRKRVDGQPANAKPFVILN